MANTSITIIPVNIKKVVIYNATLTCGNAGQPILRALNTHFGFDPVFHHLFFFKQDLTFKTEFSKLNIVLKIDGISEMMPDIYKHGHDKIEWFQKYKTMSPFTFKFSVTENGIHIIKMWQDRRHISEGKGFNTNNKLK